jgi:dipeptidyl aminopeptidase/acylaminoacyl peptidase
MRSLVTLLSLIVSAPVFAAEPVAPAPAKTEEPLTAESFAAPPFIEEPELSPNGKWIAARLSVGGSQLLAMQSLFDKSVKPTLLRTDSEKMSVDWWRWVNDDWLLVGISANESVEGEKWRLSRVASIERSTGKLITLGWKEAGQNAADVIWVARDGSPRILLGAQNGIYANTDEFWPEVREYDVSTGKSKIAVRRRAYVTDYYADGSGNVRLGYGYIPDSRTSRLLYREPGKANFTELDRANLRKEEKLSFPSLFLAEPGKAITVQDDDKGFSGVYELDLKTLLQGKKLFGVEGYDIGGLVHTASGDGIAGVSVTENTHRVHWLDPGLAETQALFDKAVGKDRARIISWDKDRNALLVHVGGPDQAGSLYYYNRTLGGNLNRISFNDERFKMRKFASVSTITLKARDGLSMTAVLTLPKDKPAKNLPLILLPHGGPQARDSEGWDWINQFLAWKGYAVIQPNYRGSAGFGTSFMEAGEGEWGLKMQDDLNDTVSHLAKEGIADPKRVCVLGASYGGYAAMRAAQRDGTLFRCAISYAGVSDLAKLSRYDSRFLYAKEYKAHLKEQAPDYGAVSPLRFPEQFSAPILIMHGKLDLRVPVDQSRDMAAKLKAAGKDHRYVEQPLGDHHFSRQEDRLQFLKEVEAFLAKYNPA